MRRLPLRATCVAALALAAAACAHAPAAPVEVARTPAPPPTPVAPGDRSQVPVPGPAPALKVPPQRHFQLASGLKVRLVERHQLPIVSLHLVIDAGAVHDPERLPGLAGFTAAMLTEGTQRRTATELSDDLGFIGASLAANAGFDTASLSGSVLVAHLPELLDIVAEVLTAPAFRAGDFARVQDQRLVTLLQQRDQPSVVAAKAFQRAYWGDHPYGHWPLGTEASVRSTGPDDLRAFHAARWRPRGAELVVVGDVTEETLRPLLEKALAGWQGEAAPARAAPVANPGKLQTLLLPKAGAAPQAFVLMGMPGFVRASPDFVAAEVAFQVLGGGTASRLFRELREKEGYTYGIYARPEARRLGGTSVIVGSVKAEVTGAATRALLAQVQRLREEPVGAEELQVARNALLLSLPADFATTAGIAGKLAEEVVYGLPDDYWDQYAAQVQQVTAEDVRRVAEKYLDPARLTTVMVCDPATVQPQLAGLPLGTVEVRSAGPARGAAPEAAPAAASGSPTSRPPAGTRPRRKPAPAARPAP